MKRNSGHRGMTREDHLLWKRVADTTIPMSRKRASVLEDEMIRLMANASPEPAKQPVPEGQRKPLLPLDPVPTNHNTKPVSNPIEQRIIQKLARGRQKIDSRIDLHGMTQDRARFALLDFLQMAQSADHRIVLVITGKGNEGMGVLRRNVPLWLTAPPFLPIVNGFREAHLSHGGEGALYVRIRRRRQNRIQR